LKRLFFLFAAILSVLLPLASCAAPSPPLLPPTNGRGEPVPAVSAEELRGVWLSYVELTQAAGTGRRQFRARYDKLFAQMESFGLNAVFVQVRPFSDALYPSGLFPWSAILTGKQGEDPGYDPLGLLLALAKDHGLALHAWLNPFRIATRADWGRLSEDHPARKHKTDGWVRGAEGGLYWNPALPEVHALIYAGLRELLKDYKVAGVHIDDYFYPTADAGFDAAQFGAYRKQGGGLALEDWRRELVSQFVAGFYREAKNARPDVIVSVSPGGNPDRNRALLFADTERWLAEPGFADWIIPQLYFGFSHEKLPFEATARHWAELPRDKTVRLLAGLAAYKAGTEDTFAGDGAAEWQTGGDILARQLALCRSLPGYDGFALYSAGMFETTVSKIVNSERENLQQEVNSKERNAFCAKKEKNNVVVLALMWYYVERSGYKK
jgi:uncharacterized lipoprotein YddW (UPF0748 family)